LPGATDGGVAGDVGAEATRLSSWSGWLVKVKLHFDGGRAAYLASIRWQAQRQFENKLQYRQLLLDVFRKSNELLQRDGIVYVRTDRRKITLNTTKEVLREIFPDHQLRCKSRPYVRPTQTRLFGHAEPRVGEIDLILTP
jgi:hypothetical protein